MPQNFREWLETLVFVAAVTALFFAIPFPV